MSRVSLLLLLALVGSGLVLVRTSYETRHLFAEIERAKADEQQLLADSKRLDAERRSEGTNLRIERDAREKMSMRMAGPDVTIYVADSPSAGGSR